MQSYLNLLGADMARTPLRLGPGECSDAETGARYFAALSFPGPEEETRRDDLANAMSGRYVHEAMNLEWGHEVLADPRLTRHGILDPRWCREQMRGLRQRLEARADAARAVRPMVKELYGHAHRQVSGIEKFNQRQILLKLCDDDEEAAENFRHRKAQTTRPVLHLAVAQDIWLCANVTDSQTDLGLVAPDMYRTLVEWSADLRIRLTRDRRFGVTEADLLPLHWVN